MFIQSPWLDGYFTMKFPNGSKRVNLPEIDFRLEGWRAFNAYAIFCAVAGSMITNAMNVFLKNEFITAQALSCKYRHAMRDVDVMKLWSVNKVVYM